MQENNLNENIKEVASSNYEASNVDESPIRCLSSIPSSASSLSSDENKTVRYINVSDRQIILLGTAHVSKESIEDVRTLIRTEMPDVVCIELDDARYNALTNPDSWKEINIIKLLKEGKGFLLLANLSLQAFQKKLGLDLGVKPGDEMKAAIESARALDLKTEMVDRPIHMTLKRAWGRSSLMGKSKLIATLLAGAFTQEKLSPEEIEKLKKQSAMDGVMKEVSQYLPSVKEVIIDERDQYLASKIWQVEAKKSLAVLGAGHLPGVQKWIEAYSKNEADVNCVKDLEIIPPKSFLRNALSFLFPTLIIALIVAGFIKGGLSTTKTQLIHYTLWNGGLAAVGSLLALANPITIIAAFLIAPLTSINPFIGVGFFTGIIEAFIRKPKVKDMENLSDDICTFTGWYRNRITHSLLVFFLSSVGSSIGTFITVPSLILNIFK